ncbi:hypothetical protein SE17_11230 [Kouleothrix aurantiaca]|jgi:hypothetical protein|uniref:Uncharacterized protein n=1 Tax=Kouleothrix aurantiaca TaxID=186479 RepID=A0A0P9HEJ0_9CHLR|nr:hypothetical protein SE17_11230 [Kouleothrix aurantiaca]
MIQRRLLEIVGTLVMGDGLAFLFAPRRHMLIWVEALDLPLWQRTVQWFADNEAAGRATGVLEMMLGAWLTARAYRGVE